MMFECELYYGYVIVCDYVMFMLNQQVCYDICVVDGEIGGLLMMMIEECDDCELFLCFEYCMMLMVMDDSEEVWQMYGIVKEVYCMLDIDIVCLICEYVQGCKDFDLLY